MVEDLKLLLLPQILAGYQNTTDNRFYNEKH